MPAMHDATEAPLLLILESPPYGLPDDAGALPTDSLWFHQAVCRWGVSAALLAPVARINALPEPPQGCWYPTAVRRVRRAITRHRPRVIIGAGWVARSAVRGALRLGERLPWLEAVEHLGRHVVAVPHFSGRNRLLDDWKVRAATTVAFKRAFAAAAA